MYLAKELATNKQIACKVVDLDIAIRSVSESRPDRCESGALWKSGVESAKRHRKKVLLEIEILSKLSHVSVLTFDVHLTSSNVYSQTLSRSGKHSVQPMRCIFLLLGHLTHLISHRYIFTDLAPAGDLYSYTQSRGGRLDDYDARVVTKQITLAVEYLHSEDIAHRDIKQENVLVTSTDFGGRVLLTDFGFATHANVTNGKMGRMLSKVGTPGFVAP